MTFMKTAMKTCCIKVFEQFQSMTFIYDIYDKNTKHHLIGERKEQKHG